MKSRFIFSLCGMVLAAVLVVGGFSLAWFTDQATSSDTPAMHTGTVDVKVTEAEVELAKGVTETQTQADDETWYRGQDRDFIWTLENTGTKAAYLRVKLVEEMEVAESGDGVKEDALINWSNPNGGWVRSKDDHYYYHESTVPAGESVDLELTGSLPDENGTPSGTYTVRLKAEAVQASDEAINHVWSSHPLGDD